MRYLRFQDKDGKKSYGILEGETITRLEGDLFGEHRPTGEKLPLGDVRVLAPCEPSKIVAVGLNYAAHAAEAGETPPPTPLLFFKPSTCVIGPEEDIEYPPAVTRLDYECELGVVIGKRAKFVKEEDVDDYILGYTCCNDVSARNLQWTEGQWARGKGLDTSGVIGPVITDEVDPGNLHIQTRLNGEVKQDSNTSDLIFKIPRIIACITEVMTLLPGDVVMTGTPSGISPMEDGDVVEVEVEGIGVLRNKVVKVRP